jgi:NAD(P)-dependent dehydrogenase (short-subunit alcohol dehydrogenase family)
MAKTKTTSSIPRLMRFAAIGAGIFLTGHSIYREITKFNVRNKVILITGGSRGLGLVLARQLAAKGAKLVLCGRSEEHLKKAKEELKARNSRVLTVQTDITNQAQVQNLINAIIDHYGTLDVLINNAGIIQVGPAEAMEIEDYEKAMQTNFWGPLYAIYASLPHFKAKGEGRIVNITSIGGKIATPHILPYTASKFAITGLSEGLHAELKKHNIKVTTVVPNLMRTGSPRNIDVKGDHEEEYAWFKISDSSHLLAQEVELSAKQIINAIEYGEAEKTLSLTAKAATIVQGIAPGWMGTLMAVVNKFLPDNTPDGFIRKKGYQVESDRSRGPVASLTDRAALKNNEM